jgi:hypothetical protein
MGLFVGGFFEGMDWIGMEWVGFWLTPEPYLQRRYYVAYPDFQLYTEPSGRR